MSQAVIDRIAELAIIGKCRKFKAIEAVEWEESRKYLLNYQWKIARYMNLMYAARIAKDWAWFSELAREYIDFVSGR